MLADIGRVGWETGVSLTTGQMPEDIEYYSGFGKAIVDQDMGTLDALWSIPKGIALTPWRLGTAIYQGDAFGVGYETVSLIGALEGARTLGAGRVNVPGLGAIDRGATYVRDLSDTVGVANRLDLSSFGNLEAPQYDATQINFGDIPARTGATLGYSQSFNYRATFFEANPGLEGNVVVHHAVEQQVLTRYPGVAAPEQIHSLENLRGIPKEVNSDLHLSTIRREWNKFYRETPNATLPQLLRKATEIDSKYGSQFNPKVK
ncbi:hypothetical protein [Xanthomonas phaseoli]|uniref:hypothetical protein n=1 Tax=Xanthomonas phaseoli TaxID=1985254 RepID=UPI0016398839|nr:hypothetical protein [Xanthomonas phaseoli]